MHMGAFGYMDALRYTYTNAEANDTKKDINGLAGYDSPKRTYMCE